MNIIKNILNLIYRKRGERERRERAKRSLVVLIFMFIALFASIVLHNLLSGIFNSEELVFFVLTLSIALILPFYLVYTTVVVLDYLYRKYLKGK